jgi:molecular chaperone DnaK (HSP70)
MMGDENRPGIIGIDFGGISSSAVFAIDNGQNPNLKVLDQWPKATPRFLKQVLGNAEIESIVYRDQRFKVVGWSEDENEVITPEGGIKPGLYVFRDFKSELFPPEDYPEELKAAIKVPGTTAEDISVDYLSHLRRSVLHQVQGQLERSGTAQGNLQIVMTTPSFWNDEAKASFREIATNAGFAAKPDEKFDLISGLEAAIRHAEFMQPAAFSVGETFLVVDCGGHFVEAAVFEVKAKNPVRFEKRTKVSASSCGSAGVTRRFLNLMSDKIDRTGISPLKLRTKRGMRYRCRKQFEKEVLLGLGSVTFQPPSEDLSGFWVADLGVEIECPEADLTEGYMSFGEDEVYSCFDFAIERTLELVKEQIAAVQVQGLQLQGCLLVGGFNKCVYYSDRVQTGIAALGLKMIRSDHDPLAFAKGSVLAGLNDSFGHI